MTLEKNEEALREDGTQRKSHYGSGAQPWDDMKRLGWAHHFAAGSILKYLRRDKNKGHSLESARWYWARLKELRVDKYYHWQMETTQALQGLERTLTEQEYACLEMNLLP